jgi:hypothetical protein
MCFSSEDAGALLARHFALVDRFDASGWIVFPDREAAQAFVEATMTLRGELPQFEGPLRVRRTPCVFVATK